MAQDINQKHWVAEISRVAAVYGTGHILSAEMDKNRDNGELVSLGAYQGGEYYAAAPFDGTGFEAVVIEIVYNTNQTMVRYELTADCPAYFIQNPETMANDFLKIYQERFNYFNKEGDRSRVYPMVKHDVFTVSADAFGNTLPTVGQVVTWAEATGYTAADA